ncbi:hypothetical protein GCM10010448_34440 [Streptomyces glomeratus]|uniref:Uncharacterized protein n=1 Tax=Streptomyces glomeratus TaxID=284452 RepID=A0ABP6LK18_9ACTN
MPTAFSPVATLPVPAPARHTPFAPLLALVQGKDIASTVQGSTAGPKSRCASIPYMGEGRIPDAEQAEQVPPPGGLSVVATSGR